MRYLFSSFVFLAAGLLALPAVAAPGDKEAKKGDGGAYAEMREKILKEFDNDGDGKLSDDEREKARGKVRELRIQMAKKNSDRPAEKGARREGRPGPGGPPHMPKPEEMFAKFDKDNDGKLGKDEFKALAEFVHEHMPMPPGAGPGPPRGPGALGRGPNGAKGKGLKGHGPDGARPRDGAAAEHRFRGPEGFGFGPRGDRFARAFMMRRWGGPPFGGRFAMREFGPGPRGERFGMHGPGPWRGGDERFAMRWHGPMHRGDGPGPWGDRSGFRGPGPGGDRFAMRDDGPPRHGDGPEFDRHDGPPRDGDRRRPDGDEDRGPRRERFGRPGDGPGPEGAGPGPRGEGEGRRFHRPDGPPPGDGPPRDGEGRRFRGPDGPPGPPRDGEGPGRFFGRGPGGPPPGAGPGARGDGPRGERDFDRGDRRGPPPGDRDDGDRRPPKRDKDDDKGDKADKDKAGSAI